jgi:replicative superfamily II helicase
MVDFTKKLANKRVEKVLDPQQIYDNLDRISDKGPLRPSQISVLTKWHDNLRTKQDVILKMHTGQGKTLVGLLMLQSKLNESERPVLYLCPNNHLVDQTLEQAKQFGVSCVTSENNLPVEFLNGQAILVTSIQKLFNGKTKFGLGSQSQKVSALLMDDAHSCVDAIKDAFTIKINQTHKIYDKMIALFEMELDKQGRGTFAEIKQHQSAALLPVPYWAWMDKQSDVVEAFSKHTDDDGIKFAWPLLKDVLDKCLCLITGSELEITPYSPPLYHFGTYSQADHRIFMSATMTNDAFLIKGLGVNVETIKNPLINEQEAWSGEKMILIPSLIDKSLTDEKMVSFFGKPNEKRKAGVVVLTPSFTASVRREEAGAIKALSKNIRDILDGLIKGDREKTVVISNRYDGIDLPDSACRILILDSIPKAQSITERYLQSRREGSETQETHIARSIEQGIGRAVRGEKDYCVVVLLGPDLIMKVKLKDSQKYFSPQTRKQIEIGLSIAQMVQEDSTLKDPEAAFISLLNQSLQRDEGWKDYYAQEMKNLPPSVVDTAILELFSFEALAEKKYNEGNYTEARETIQKIIDELISSEHEKGWYLQEMARYIFPSSATESNKYQFKAHKKNHILLCPRDGMFFHKVTTIGQKRAEKIIGWIKSSESYEELSITIDALLSRLTFGIDSDVFEKAFNDLGKALGFESQRPDQEMKEGPDNLWALQENQYLLVECKNEVLSNRPSIYKTETGQMNNSIAWFRANYQGASVRNIMVHPSKQLGQGAFFNEEVLIMRDRQLRMLQQNIRSFFNEFKAIDLNDLSESKVQEYLNTHKLRVENIIGLYCIAPTQH